MKTKLFAMTLVSIFSMGVFASNVPPETKIADCGRLTDQRGGVQSIKVMPKLEIVKQTTSDGKTTEHIKGESLARGEFSEELLMEGTNWAGVTHRRSASFQVEQSGNNFKVTLIANPNMTTTCKAVN